MGPPPLHWLSVDWWCSSHSMVVWLLSVFVFFLSHVVSAIATKLCPMVLLYALCPCSSFMDDDTGSLSMPHFCLFLDPRVCLLLFPAVLAHWVLFLSLLLLGPFQALVLAITYKSRIVFPFHLLFGFPVAGPFLLKMGLNVCVCVCVGPRYLIKF